MTLSISRRDSFRTLGAGAAALAAAATVATPVSAASPTKPALRFGLNTSTIRGQKLTLIEEIEIAAAAGYDAIEPWIREIQQYDEPQRRDIKKRLADHGLTVASAIGFANWIVDDEQQRAAGLEDAKRDMDLVRSIGGAHIAAPPVGAHRTGGLKLTDVAARYAALLELGASMGVTPQLEVWGPSATLSRLSEAVFVCIETGRADACLLPDVYHLFRGGNDFNGLKLVDGKAIHVFHMNDYPAEPTREQQNDAMRVYPGDGVAPIGAILTDLRNNGFAGVLSLELFNPDYYKQDAAEVAKTGLAKMKQAAAAIGA